MNTPKNAYNNNPRYCVNQFLFGVLIKKVGWFLTFEKLKEF